MSIRTGTSLRALLPGMLLCGLAAAVAFGGTASPVSGAINLAQNLSVADVSVNNAVQSAGTSGSVYEYMPQTIQP